MLGAWAFPGLRVFPTIDQVGDVEIGHRNSQGTSVEKQVFPDAFFKPYVLLLSDQKWSPSPIAGVADVLLIAVSFGG